MLKARLLAFMACLGLFLLFAPRSAHSTTGTQSKPDGRFQSITGSTALKSPAGITWQIETVDSHGRGGCGLVLDADDHPHISYQAESPSYYDLNYARWTGSQWLIEKVVDMDLGGSTGLALDGVGRPHIGFNVCNPFYCLPKYAHWTGHAWVVEVLDGPASAPALALDTQGHPHLAYRHGNVVGKVSLRYTVWTGSRWLTETLDSIGGGYASLMLDSEDRAHISFYSDYGGENLKYVHWTGSHWNTQTVDNARYVGQYTSLALDTDGRPHISYYDWTNGDLKYARWVNSTWDMQTVDSGGDVGQYSSLALNTEDQPHISYYDATDHAIKYAHLENDEWVFDTVDAGVDGRDSIALDLDSENRPHICYNGGGTGGLKYAVGSIPSVSLHKQATPGDGLRNDDILTFTLTMSGPGLNVRLWDSLPPAVRYVSDSITGTITPPAVFSPTQNAVVWQGTLPSDTVGTVRFQVTPGMTGTGSLSLSLPIVNTAWLTDTTSGVSVSAMVIVNGWQAYLPIAMRER